jgi:hypothetical protein
MNSATILTEEKRKLHTVSQRRQRRKDQQLQCITRGGVLQAQQGQ